MSRWSHIGALLLFAAILFCAADRAMPQQNDVLQESTLRTAVEGYVAAHPDATLQDVARYANARLPEHGINYLFYTSEPLGRELVLNAGERHLLVRTADDVEPGACGEHWVPIPAVYADRQRIDVVHEGRVHSVRRPEGLTLDKMTIYSADQRRVVNEFEIPWYGSFPDGVLADGSAVLLAFGLDSSLDPWWQRVRAAHEQIATSQPFLLLRVSADRLSFAEDPRLYPSEPVESIKGFPRSTEDAYLQRWRFLSSGLVVEFHSPCT